MKCGWLAALWLAATCASVAQAADVQRYQRENVLGTSFEMTVVGASKEASNAALTAVLAEVERLDAVFNTWGADSELARANRADATVLSQDLRHVLGQCERWREHSEGAFSCRLGSVIECWKNAAAATSATALPDRVEMRRLARGIAQVEVDLAAVSVVRAEELRWQVDGIAKGYILDQAMQRARIAAPHASGIKLDIGGDAVYWGVAEHDQPWRVAVADPLAPRDNGTPLATLSLRSKAVASSGHRSRGYRIGRRQFSHILDPSDGWPVQYPPSATVVADDAATADALATALSVMPIREGLAWVERLPGVEALIVSERGVPFASRGWSSLLAPESVSEPAWATPLVIDYEIPVQPSERYRRPYLALWIAEADGTPVRQLLVLGDRSRYLRELPQWWRYYGRDDEAAVHGIARPTRLPGQYSLVWDGRDDLGHPRPAGEYRIEVEAAREHGSRQRLSIPFTSGSHGATHSPRAGDEIGRINARWTTAIPDADDAR